MTIDVLTIEEAAYSGFTHQAAVTFSDLAALPAGLTGSLTIGVVGAQDIVTAAAIVVDTNFVGAGITSLTVAGADTNSGTLFSAQSVLSGATPIVAKVFALTLSYPGAFNLVLNLTSVGANLNLATAGQFRVLYSKNSLAKYAKY
jgi:hypothetical protein